MCCLSFVRIEVYLKTKVRTLVIAAFRTGRNGTFLGSISKSKSAETTPEAPSHAEAEAEEEGTFLTRSPTKLFFFTDVDIHEVHAGDRLRP